MNNTNFGKTSRLYHPYSWWTSCEEQVVITKRFLELFGGDEGFTTNDIPPIPECFAKIAMSQERLEYGEITMPYGRGMVSDIYDQVLMLVVILPDKNKQRRSIQRTFNSWLNFVDLFHGHKIVEHNYMKSDYDHLKLYGGVENKPGIYWVWFDPCANHGISPKACRRDKKLIPFLAHVHILIAMSLFPEWSDSWDGKESPYPMLSGYQVFLKTWKYVPYFSPPQDDIRTKLSITPHDYYINECSSPIVIDFDTNNFFVP